MPRLRIDTDHVLSVTDAAKRGVSRLVADAEGGDELVIVRNGKPVAAVVGIQRLSDVQRMEQNLLDLVLAISRSLDDDGRRTAFEDVVREFGLTREDLDRAED